MKTELIPRHQLLREWHELIGNVGCRLYPTRHRPIYIALLIIGPGGYAASMKIFDVISKIEWR